MGHDHGEVFGNHETVDYLKQQQYSDTSFWRLLRPLTSPMSKTEQIVGPAGAMLFLWLGVQVCRTTEPRIPPIRRGVPHYPRLI